MGSAVGTEQLRVGHKGPCRVATTVAVSLGAAPNSVDGVSLAQFDRILVKNQAAPAQNGVYYVQVVGTGASGVWVRARDFDNVRNVLPGTSVRIVEGTANGGKSFYLDTPGPIVVGTTALTWTQEGSGGIQTLAQVLTTGNATGGNDMIQSAGDRLVGEGDAFGGYDVNIEGGTAVAPGGAVDGGDVNVTPGVGLLGGSDGRFISWGVTKLIDKFERGTYALARNLLESVFATGTFSAAGDAQRTESCWLGFTSNATPKNLTIDNGTSRYVLPPNSAIKATFEIIARSAGGNVAGWKVSVVAKRGVGLATITIVGSPVVEVTGFDAPLLAASVDVVADTVNGCLTPRVTGIPATVIQWVATSTGVQVVG